MTPQLAALFAAHKTAILGGGAAAVAGLALLQKRKKATGTTAAATAATPAGTIPAAAVVPATGTAGGSYDSSVNDLYSALQPELEALRQTGATTSTGTTGDTAVAAPAKPIASTLLAPVGSGHYVQNGNGTIGEVESDGSVYGMQLGEWMPYWNAGARPTASISNDITMYAIGQNLAAAQKAAAGSS